jgi:hypothetical protein
MSGRPYLSGLASHPATPIAAALTAVGFLVGAHGDRWLAGGLFGAAVMSVYWLPVLWTARRGRHR